MKRIFALLLALVLGLLALPPASFAAEKAAKPVAEKPVLLTQLGQKAGNYQNLQIDSFNVGAVWNKGPNPSRGSLKIFYDAVPNTAAWFVICSGKCPPYQTGQDGALTLYPIVIKGYLVPKPVSEPDVGYIVTLTGAKCRFSPPWKVDKAFIKCLDKDLKAQFIPQLKK